MPVSLSDFCVDIQEALGLDSSYLATYLPNSVRRRVKRLLRDYNFPKAVTKATYVAIPDGTQSFDLPDYFKHALLAVFYDDSGDTPIYGAPLWKRETFVSPASTTPTYFWIEGTKLWIDAETDTAGSTSNLALVYSSVDADTQQAWLLEDFEDIVFNMCCFYTAVALSKTEIIPAWERLWIEDQKALAIYVNEQNFTDLDLVARMPSASILANRYPA